MIHPTSQNRFPDQCPDRADPKRIPVVDAVVTNRWPALKSAPVTSRRATASLACGLGKSGTPRRVVSLTATDVVLGQRDSFARYHEIVETHASEFRGALSISYKHRIAGRVLRLIRRGGGRFLRRSSTPTPTSHTQIWLEVNDRDALEAITEALQDATSTLAPTNESTPLAPPHAVTVTSKDVLMGQGISFIRHPGNVRLVQLVVTRAHKCTASRATLVEQIRVAQNIKDDIHRGGGRFLRRMDPTLDAHVPVDSWHWRVVEEENATETIRQALHQASLQQSTQLDGAAQTRPPRESTSVQCAPTAQSVAHGNARSRQGVTTNHSPGHVRMDKRATNRASVPRPTCTAHADDIDHSGGRFWSLRADAMSEWNQVKDTENTQQSRHGGTATSLSVSGDEVVRQGPRSVCGTSSPMEAFAEVAAAQTPLPVAEASVTTTLAVHDVVVGPGADQHAGNVRFRQLLDACHGDDSITWFAQEILHEIHRCGGRVVRAQSTSRSPSAWIVLEDHEAIYNIKRELLIHHFQQRTGTVFPRSLSSEPIAESDNDQSIPNATSRSHSAAVTPELARFGTMATNADNHQIQLGPSISAFPPLRPWHDAMKSPVATRPKRPLVRDHDSSPHVAPAPGSVKTYGPLATMSEQLLQHFLQKHSRHNSAGMDDATTTRNAGCATRPDNLGAAAPREPVRKRTLTPPSRIGSMTTATEPWCPVKRARMAV